MNSNSTISSTISSSSITSATGAVSEIPASAAQKARRKAKKQRNKANKKLRATSTASATSNTSAHRNLTGPSAIHECKQDLRQKLLQRVSSLEHNRRGNTNHTTPSPSSHKTDENLQRVAAAALGLDTTSQDALVKSLRDKHPTMYDSIVNILQSSDSGALLRSLMQQIEEITKTSMTDIAAPDQFV